MISLLSGVASHLVASASVVLLIALASTNAYAQQPAPNQPIDLPEFIVTGKERIEVPSSAKQPPAKPLTLKAQVLDSLNPTEKHPLPKLPAHALPSPTRKYTMWPGYIKASLGNYITPAVQAGYTLKAGGYRFDIRGSAEGATDAWAPNAEYFKASAALLSTYTAPPEFLFFAGSVTEVDLGYRLNRYNLYALPNAPSRSATKLHAGVDVVGDYEGFNYRGAASFSSASMDTDSLGVSTAPGASSVSDNMLRGLLTLEQRWERYDVGARLDLRFPTFAGQAYPFLEGNVFARFSSEHLRVTAGIGAQTSTSTQNVSRFGLLIVGDVDLFIGRALTLQANVRSGLRQVTFSSLLDENPYVSSAVVLDAAYDVFDVKGAFVVRPSLQLSATAGIRLRQTERQPIWVGDATQTFQPIYGTVTVMEIPADVRWLVSHRDVITADFTLTMARVDTVDQPYVPAVKASMAYERDWTPSLRSTIGAVYIGDRFADLANRISLSGYVDIRIRAEYDITPTFSAHIRADNIMSSTIVLWNGYAERGAFFSGGITWKF